MERQETGLGSPDVMCRPADEHVQRAAWRRLWAILLSSAAAPYTAVDREQAETSATETTLAAGGSDSDEVDGDE